MIKRLAPFFLILIIAAVLDAFVFLLLMLYSHTVGPVLGWILQILSFILLPPMVLGLIANDVPPVLFHLVVWVLEALYVWGIWRVVMSRGPKNVAKAIE